MAPESVRTAALVVCGLGLILVARAAGRRINEVCFECYGVRSVNVLTTLFVSLLWVAAGGALASMAMASGWEPFADARVAFPWPYHEPDDARLLGIAVPTICAVIMAGATTILARRTTPRLALRTVACLVVLGLASANPIIFPVVALLCVFEWGHTINDRSEDDPMTAGTILLAAFGWICVGIGACASDPTVAGVLLGVGATGLLALLVCVWHREGLVLALETIACATLQAALYSTFVALIAVGLTAGHSERHRRA